MLFPLMIVLLVASAQAADLCDIIQVPNCAGVKKQVRRLSSLSYPSPATASNSNPAQVSLDRGFGVEFMAQTGNSALFNLAGGTGKIGGALISSSLENSFFGNRVVELDQKFLERNKDDKQFARKKYSIAVGGRLIKSKHFSLDAGMIFKRHNEIKDINNGLGFSGRWGPVSFGASVYKDDFLLKRADVYSVTSVYDQAVVNKNKDYIEAFNVQTLSAGLKLGDLTLDAGLIQTKYKLYKDHSVTRIYAASYSFRNLLLNFATRQEDSNASKYADGKLVADKKQNAIFGGAQYSFGKRLILGFNYNYFLLREVALTGSLFY